jgi:16S rRNA processing protein RimM
MGAKTDEMFLLGRIVGTHGLRGDLKLRPLADESEALTTAREITLRFANGSSEVFRLLRADRHNRLWLLRLEGRETIEAAQPLIGCEVLVPLEDLPPLAAGEYYWYQLKGLTVTDRQRGDIGTIVDLFTTAAHDIYVVQGPYGEVLVPAVGEFVLEIDPEVGQVLVDLPDGLIPESDEV